MEAKEILEERVVAKEHQFCYTVFYTQKGSGLQTVIYRPKPQGKCGDLT
jgi:hypothetical protein